MSCYITTSGSKQSAHLTGCSVWNKGLACRVSDGLVCDVVVAIFVLLLQLARLVHTGCLLGCLTGYVGGGGACLAYGMCISNMTLPQLQLLYPCQVR